MGTADFCLPVVDGVITVSMGRPGFALRILGIGIGVALHSMRVGLLWALVDRT